MSQFIKTFGRIRPSANGNGASALVLTEKSVKIDTENGQKSYDLHRIFNSDATQQDVFLCVAKKIVEDSADGFNGTIFAYGQTGSGKTHTMLGPSNSWSEPAKKGLIPRSVDYLFELLDAKTKECQKFTFVVDVEFVELYNEEIFDLLNMKNKVQLRDLGKDVQLVGTKAESVDNSLDLMHIVQRGWQSRSTGSTAMNNESSRSHALLIVKIKTVEVTGDLIKERTSTLNLVDLAGSERQSHTKATGDRLKEATNINSSLTVLGRCIRILSNPKQGQTYVPFRDSHLTHILKNSLGGNSKTAVIVNMHPDRDFLTETSSTLHFAQSCTLIKNVVTRNEVMTGDQENSYKKAIQELRREVDEARAKAREEFEKKLDVAEHTQLRLIRENDSLKSENSDIRAKYNMALVKYVVGDGSGQSLETIEKLVSSSLPNDSSTSQTLKLEKEALEKRCHQLQQERDALHDRYQQNLSTTLAMQTPDAKSRRKSRRETQYRASLSRLANQVDEEDISERLEEADTIISKLQSEKQLLESNLELAKEKEYETERKYTESINVLQREKSELERDLKLAYEENDACESKIKNNAETLNYLLARINTLELVTKNLETSKKEGEEKMGKEMDDLTTHSRLRENELNDQLADMTESYESLKSRMHQQEQDMAAKNTALQEQMSQKNEVLLNERSETINQLQKDLQEKSEMTSYLQLKIQEKEEELKNRADLVRSLEQEIIKKASVIAQQDAKLDENVEALSNYNSVKRRLEESKENEDHMKKRLEEMKRQMQTQFDDHHKDIKNVKARKDQEIKSLTESLAITAKSLKEQEARFKKQKSEEQKKFDEKMVDMEKMFNDMKVEALKKNEEKIRRESLHQMETSLLAKNDEIRELKEMKDYFEKQHNEDSLLLAGQINSKPQRINYVEKIRREKLELEEENKSLRSEVARLSRLTLKGNPEVNRPVLRSRNTGPK